MVDPQKAAEQIEAQFSYPGEHTGVFAERFNTLRELAQTLARYVLSLADKADDERAREIAYAVLDGFITIAQEKHAIETIAAALDAAEARGMKKERERKTIPGEDRDALELVISIATMLGRPAVRALASDILAAGFKRGA